MVCDLLQKVPQAGILDGGTKIQRLHGHTVYLKKALVDHNGAPGHPVLGIGEMEHIGIDHHHGLRVYGNLVRIAVDKSLSLGAPKQLNIVVPLEILLYGIDDRIVKVNEWKELVSEPVIVITV
jgi:hypothetical protein